MTDENPYAPPSAEVEVADSYQSELATRGARLGGSLIDGIVLMVAILIVMLPFDYFELAATDELSITDNLTLFFVSMTLWLLINGYTISTRGQSIGKMIVGTRIVSYPDGKLLPLIKIFVLRHMVITAIGMFPYVGGILAIINIVMIFRDDRRCGHDLLAGTHVVKADSLPAKA